MAEQNKLKIGWFSFTCCEDSSIVFTELLNEHFFEWKKLVDFKHIRILKTDNELNDLDVAFVEGAISSKKQEDELKKIREHCKKLVAIGSCACTGLPSGQRNSFPLEILEKYKDLFDRFKYAEKVQKLEELVQVDDRVDGCPMKGEEFVEKLNDILQEFGISKQENQSGDLNVKSADTVQ